jgi:hypothetical protein
MFQIKSSLDTFGMKDSASVDVLVLMLDGTDAAFASVLAHVQGHAADFRALHGRCDVKAITKVLVMVMVIIVI